LIVSLQADQLSYGAAEPQLLTFTLTNPDLS
jgi:hypothetical protein